MTIRREWEALERRTLAPYALRAADSRGRAVREPEHPYRTAFQRDHDRIIHSTPFRRLEYKTQVFVIHEGDYYRTRLTHSLEVAQLAVAVARSLRLNGDLVRTLALAHDLGHGPFGHAGEETLAELMREHGGFDHNLQGLRIVDRLERRYAAFPGLNLTWEVRDGINKHRALLPGVGRPPGQLSLEAQVVDLADEIAYDHHDLDDGLTSGLIREEALERIPLWRRVRREVAGKFPRLASDIRRHEVIRRLIDVTVTDLVRTSGRRLRAAKIRSAAQAQALPTRLIVFSSAMKRERVPLKRFLYREMYQHPQVVRMAEKAHRTLTGLFEAYLRRPALLPKPARLRLREEEPHRVVCDYIAGMTDRFALQEYRKIVLP
ncbi:MAG: deoxyguanosinetriphosphate triphosphohydrolase [Candidatus Omnitrophica bacterium CG11_big_fil_rev_8_21_14_0_20_64_10]|nr:MAG: deoxyguanosinetriphosphate triphosphohydrolase [Candidatus Omnitrophica bacterium CG11_big_fil_rev_8_21_14_0_20_64_10]